METIVTDHHQAGRGAARVPDPAPGARAAIRSPSLCGTAVAWKLACALGARAAAARIEPDRARTSISWRWRRLPTWCRWSERTGRWCKRGLAEMRRAKRVGLRALIAVVQMRADPARRGRPGISPGAADQCGRAPLPRRCRGRAVADRGRGAGRGDRRRAGPRQLRAPGDRARGRCRRRGRAAGAARPSPRGAGPGPGRATDGTRAWSGSSPRDWSSATTGRSVVISLDEEGGGRGCGRSIAGFDLHAALEACSEHLESFGGHRAAAGLSLRAESLDAFREAFAAHATEVLGPEELRRTERIDAMVGGVGLGLDLAEELGRLAPFGMGNPGVRLMVPSARVSDVRTMGRGQARPLQPPQRRPPRPRGGLRALQPRRRRGRLGRRGDPARGQPLEWLGRAARGPARAVPARGGGRRGNPSHPCHCEDGEWWRRFEAELAATIPRQLEARSRRSRGDRRGGSCAAPAPPPWRSPSWSPAAPGSWPSAPMPRDARRWPAARPGSPASTAAPRWIACQRCGHAEVAALAGRGGGGLALADYAVLEAEPALAAEFEHVVLIDPP